ncbi:hypothetical protein ACIO87_29855 [Streptomyces sp. NPDC087218]|uniref:hypothetical protein n=1 Tax=Streptomyces sp. NPDC087218 TaxID=3365769 RepID=UPI0037FB859F
MNAGCALLVAVPSGWLGAWSLSATGEGTPGSNKAVGLLLGLALGAVIIAVTQTVRALRGERGEYFETHEEGLVHGSHRGATGRPWHRVTSLHVEGDAVNALAARLGNGYRIEITFDDGTRLRTDGLARHAADLGRVLLLRCPHIALKPRVPRYAKAGAWLLAGAAACTAAIIAMIVYMATHATGERRTHHLAGGLTDVTTEPGIGETGIMFLTFAMMACAITAITLVVAYVRGRAHR